MKRLTLTLLLVAFALLPVFAADPLPSGYGGIQLGMTIEQVKEILQKNPQFGYRGERDVSLLPGENRVLIETDSSVSAPYSFLTQCWFQFYDGKLYTSASYIPSRVSLCESSSPSMSIIFR